MSTIVPTLGFEDALRALTDDYSPPCVPHLTRASVPKKWIIAVAGGQHEINDETFRELVNAQCIVADKEHFVPTAYAREHLNALT